jgi:hypothetical protein
MIGGAGDRLTVNSELARRVTQMPIEEFYGRPESDIVTFTEKSLHFSASLVKNKGLSEFEYARIGVDPELRRIYLAFQKDPAPGLPRFYQQSSRSKRKMIAIGRLYSKYDWIGVLKTEKDRAKKQFVLEDVDPEQTDIYPKFKYFITIGYSWSSERDFQDPTQFPEEPGVYRLKKDGEIVRIGESRNIATRLREHLNAYGQDVDKFDFEIVPNDSERKEEQKRLLGAFKSAVGRLPKYNPITN